MNTATSAWARPKSGKIGIALLHPHPYRRGLPAMHVPKLPNNFTLVLLRIVLTVACLQGPFATLLVGQASDPVSEAEHLMKKGQPDKALELLNPLSATTPEPKGSEYLRGLILYEKGDLQGAETAFAKASAQDPEDV